jgi:hypothetical protein
MYSDVSLANAPRWKQCLMLLHMVFMGYPRTFNTLFWVVVMGVAVGFYALARWLTEASSLAVLPWAICIVLLLFLNNYHHALRQVQENARKDEDYRYRLEEKYSDLKNHPFLPNKIRRELSLPVRDKDGVVLINDERFIPADIEDISLDKA